MLTPGARWGSQRRKMKWCSQCKIPVVRKCCFCVPVRKGVIIFGYVNLVLTLLALPFLLFLLVEEATSEGPERPEPEKNPLVHLPLTLAFLLADIVMYIVLLVGAHKRSRSLLRGYLYFGLVFQLLTLGMDLAYFDLQAGLESAVYFLFLVLNVYLLFLVYNTIRVIDEGSVQYVAHRDLRQLVT